MPLPVAHALIGASVVAMSRANVTLSRDWKPLSAGALVALSPDFDYLFVWVLHMDRGWHRSFSHSLAYAILAGLAAAALAGAFRIKDTAIYSLAALTHSLLDALTTKENYGVELFWPLSHQDIKLGMFHYLDAPLKLGQLPWPDRLMGIASISLIELAVLAPLFAVLLLVKRKRTSSLAGRA